jgi:5'-nucleotidase / UDP-sugar diphosphatase
MLSRTFLSRLCLMIFILPVIILTSALASTTDLRIIYLNDFHGWAESPPQPNRDEGLGGAAPLAAQVKLRRQEKPSLFLAAGDMIQGSSWTNFFKGSSTIKLLNLMNLDAMVVGNHEFEFGLLELQARINEANFPMLGANVIGVSNLKPFIIKEVQGLKVAIIGVVTPQTAHINAVRQDPQLKILSPWKTLKKYLPQLKQCADIIIVLSHLGFPEDLKLAAKVKGIGVIVGGHSHTRLENPFWVGKTIIVQAWEHGKTLGVLDLQISQGRISSSQGHLEKIITASGPGDEAVRQLVGQYRGQVDQVLGQVIGDTTVFLDGENIHTQETNLGNWLADIVRQTANADLAILNSGGIRRSLPAGPIRIGDIFDMIPFENYIVAQATTGREIRLILEHGLSSLPQAAPHFLQVSGLKLRYDLSAPPGRRLQEVQIGGHPLVADKKYLLATIDFLAAGGDDYQMLPEIFFGGPKQTATARANSPPEPAFIAPGQPFRQIVCDYLKTLKTISPAVEGRIRENK